jgi:phospholipase C
MRKWTRRLAPAAVVLAAGAAAASATTIRAAGPPGPPGPPSPGNPATPIKHIVVIFQENVSFDHYFGTYPFALNKPGDGQTFTPAKGTPDVNGLTWSLLAANPNSSNPMRLDSSPTGLAGSPGGQITCDQDHDYSDEQQAFDGGKMDQFVQSVGTGGGNIPGGARPCDAKVVMDYYDGNTVTALWNYAQHYAMSDNSFGTTFGPSAPGAINLVSGDTGGVDTGHEAQPAGSPVTISTSSAPNNDITPDGQGGYSLTSDAQPYWDDCSTRDAVALKGQNIGDILNQHHLSWGWFQGGERPSTSFADALTDIGAGGQKTSTFTPDEFKSFFATAANRPAHSSNQSLCDSVHPVGVALGATAAQTAPLNFGFKDDYIPHHEPFNYYESTANPHHLTIPTDGMGNDTLAGLKEIGTDTQSYANGVPQFDTPNHQYDTSDFDQLVHAITDEGLSPDYLPAVSFIKAPGYEDGHAAYSDPADEQQFIVHIVNELEQSPDWSSTAIFINYDDSDGWYDHAFSGVTNQSKSVADNLTNTVLGGPPPATTSGLCTPTPAAPPAPPGPHGPSAPGPGPLAGQQGRCGFGPRLPMLVLSPYARTNFVDHNLSDQSSIINFVEYNWHLPGIPGSFDEVLDPLDHHEGIPFDLAGMFDFGAPPNTSQYVLNPNTGSP